MAMPRPNGTRRPTCNACIFGLCVTSVSSDIHANPDLLKHDLVISVVAKETFKNEVLGALVVT